MTRNRHSDTQKSRTLESCQTQLGSTAPAVAWSVSTDEAMPERTLRLASDSSSSLESRCEASAIARSCHASRPSVLARLDLGESEGGK